MTTDDRTCITCDYRYKAPERYPCSHCWGESKWVRKEQDYPNPERCRICSGREAPSLSAKYLDIKFHKENCIK